MRSTQSSKKITNKIFTLNIELSEDEAAVILNYLDRVAGNSQFPHLPPEIFNLMNILKDFLLNRDRRVTENETRNV